MKNNYNTLQSYILEYSVKDYKEETVNGLFRSILEPIVSNQKFEGCVFFRLNDLTEKYSLIKRLSFSQAKLFSFNDSLVEFGLNDLQKDNIWGKSEFLIVLGKRYSACVVWDFSLGETNSTTPVCLLYNSKIINEIAKVISLNSKENFKDLLSLYVPDRRENSILNKSINNIVYLIDEISNEISYEFAQKQSLEELDENLITARTVANKAKFIAHEIKNNLSIVNLYTKIIQKRLEKIGIDEENSASINNAMKNIEKASRSISYLTSDLRCMSTPYITEFLLDEMINSVISLCEPKAKDNNVVIKYSEDDSFRINSDRAKLDCALMNIIFNAIESKNTKKITIKTTFESNCINIFISNDGEKISEEIQNKIFELDFTTKEKGNGIGLSFCRAQIQEIGGDILLVESSEIRTTFKITIPQ